MENKVVRIIGPSAELDVLVAQISKTPGVYIQEFTLDDLEHQLRLNMLLWHAQRSREVSHAVAEFEEHTFKMLKKAGVL